MGEINYQKWENICSVISKRSLTNYINFSAFRLHFFIGIREHSAFVTHVVQIFSSSYCVLTSVLLATCVTWKTNLLWYPTFLQVLGSILYF